MQVHMRLRDLFDSGVLLEMAYTQKKAERVIIGLERPINDHLLKLWTTSDSSDSEIWIGNLINWIDEIGEIGFRPNNARPPHTFYYKILFFEPFGGGSGIPNIIRRLRRLYRAGFPVEIDIEPNTLLSRLQAFHRDLSGLYASKFMETTKFAASLKTTELGRHI
jgi:hypothetical protein